MVWTFYISVNTEILKIFAFCYTALYFNGFKFDGCIEWQTPYCGHTESSLHFGKASQTAWHETDCRAIMPLSNPTSTEVYDERRKQNQSQ